MHLRQDKYHCWHVAVTEAGTICSILRRVFEVFAIYQRGMVSVCFQVGSAGNRTTSECQHDKHCPYEVKTRNGVDPNHLTISSVMLSLWNALGVPPKKIPVNATILVSFIFPPLVCYLALAALAVIPQTRATRIALWPTFALLALRGVASVDMSRDNPDLRVINGFFAVSTFNANLPILRAETFPSQCTMFILTVRALEWTLVKEPLVRYLRPRHSSPSIIFDALDLAVNFRGYGWNWSRGFSFPQDTRPKSRLAFTLHTFLSAIANFFVCGVFQQMILSFCGPDRDTIGLGFLDETNPFFARYSRAIIVGFLQYISGYCSLQAPYDLCATIGVLFFGQDPTQWPPAFDAPWRVTSVGEFWGSRWHQWFRHIFVFLGGYPFQSLLGRTGIVFGGFLVSGFMHSLLVIGSGGTEHAWLVFLAFAMMIPVVLVERAFYQLTGKRVTGATGRIWTIVWLSTAGAMVFDAVAKTGGMSDSTFIDGVRPVKMLVERLVKGLNAYLNAI